eukprot:TRINITY_DN10687_c0_g1_i1.p1 TRINITY_DN10687_c0_g1~~TRINITY_DN10687_c0_g1_i1.p1  ORF type:complete len:348 (+),score=64.44 TRINITY_DN10687_c0_g1_i1:27-1046(+)
MALWQAAASANPRSLCLRSRFEGGSGFDGRRSMATMPKMNVFNRNTKRLQRDAASRWPNSSEFDYLRDHISLRLCDRLLDVSTNFNLKVCLDAGGMSGANVRNLQTHPTIEKIYTTDISEGMLTRDIASQEDFKIKPIRVVASEDKLPFASNSMDVILSNLSLHWVNDLPGALAQFKDILKEDGVFIGAMFGEQSLQELRSSFVMAENEIDGGVSPHVSPFTRVSDVGNLLTQAGFSLTTVDQEIFTQDYADPFVLMHDLRGMGESNAGIQRRPYTPVDTFLSASSIYQSMYGNEDGTVPASFQVIWMIGWKPHVSQPKPLRRGSQTHSLGDIGKIPEA